MLINLKKELFFRFLLLSSRRTSNGFLLLLLRPRYRRLVPLVNLSTRMTFLFPRQNHFFVLSLLVDVSFFDAH